MIIILHFVYQHLYFDTHPFYVIVPHFILVGLAPWDWILDLKVENVSHRPDQIHLLSIYVVGNRQNQAFREMPRLFVKCLDFLNCLGIWKTVIKFQNM